ncbi:MAG: hypothetical protein D6722_14435 [Bacteroidetes bacterium]|nr:MAG: hypothetical protein D6722_14435 [Bacteroidota bacterium]
MRILWLLILYGLWLSPLQAQVRQYVGLRFATNIQYFPQAGQFVLMPGTFTTGVLGAFYSQYRPMSGFSIGLNVNYKDNNGRGMTNLPVVMQDYREGLNVGHTAVEMDLKAGPRLGVVYPQIGYILGYRFYQDGFLRPGYDEEINPWYLMLPLGLTTNLPTNFGTVGFGAYYNVGLLNVIRGAGPTGGGLSDGGRQRYITLEINVTYLADER